MTKKLLNKKIVILDACTVSNGDVDFGTFESLGDVKIYDVLNGDELTEACREAEVLLVNKTRVDEKLISACPRLELICLFATGYDNVDIEAAKRRGITVCNVPRYSAQSVTQHVFAMLLEYVRNISFIGSSATTSSKAAARRPESSASASAVSSTSPPRAVFISTARGFISDSVRLFTI